MKHEDERVAKQAVEFWSTVCDQEIEYENQRLEVRAHSPVPVRLDKKTVAFINHLKIAII